MGVLTVTSIYEGGGGSQFFFWFQFSCHLARGTRADMRWSGNHLAPLAPSFFEPVCGVAILSAQGCQAERQGEEPWGCQDRLEKSMEKGMKAHTRKIMCHDDQTFCGFRLDWIRISLKNTLSALLTFFFFDTAIKRQKSGGGVGGYGS